MKSRQVIAKQEGSQAIVHCNMYFPQIQKFSPKHKFEALAEKPYSGRFFK